MRCVDPGNEVFHVLDETPEVEVGKSGEDNERRGISTRQFCVRFSMDWNAVDIKVFELGCCGQSIGKDFW